MQVQEPHRATRTGSFVLQQDADAVVALFCPVREMEWLASWHPGVVYSKSGGVELECVFTSSDQNGEATWLVTHHDPVARVVHMVKLVPELTACLLKIAVRPLPPDGSEVSVTYSHTALTPAGKELIDAFSARSYLRTMEHWQAALEYFFEHGSAMPGS